MIEKFIRFAIEKSILNHIFLLFLLFLGAFAYVSIPKEIFPPTNLDAISIRGGYAGASPDILDKMAVAPIEDELNNLSEVDEVTSVIKSGFFTIKATLKEGSNMDETLSDTKDVISLVKRDFPTDMNEPTVKMIKNGYPLVTVAIAGKKTQRELLEVAKKLKKDFSKIENLSEVVVRGDSDEILFFKLEDKKIEALELDRVAVVQAISNLSSIFPIGTIKAKGNHLSISTFNGEKDLEMIKNSFIRVGNKKIRLKDIAKISFELDDPTQISHFNALPNISIGINKAKSGNAIALVREIKEILKRYQEEYKGYKFDVYTDSSIWIRNRLNTVISNILFGLILVSLAIFVFVNGRISAVVALGIPTSFLIGLIATEMLGYSLNMLSLLGGLIALGMLVDEAIVVAENIQRHLEEGMEPKRAAVVGAREMFPAVLTATATTIFAFLPLLIMSGEIGVFIKVLPVMISILLLSSLFEAFYFLPLHALEIQKATTSPWRERFWERLNRGYRGVISGLLNYPKLSIALFLLITLGGTTILLKNSKFQLFPEFDTTQIYVSGSVDKNFDLTQTQELVSKVENILLQNLNKKDVSSITSISGMKLDAKYKAKLGDNLFHIFINLHERVPTNFYNRYINPLLSPEYSKEDKVRTHSAKEISQKIKKLTEPFTKDKNFNEFSVVIPGAGLVESDIDIAFSGKDKKVKEVIKRLKEEIVKIKGVYNVSDDLIVGEKELKIRINSYGKELGIGETYIANSLKPLFLSGEISKMFYQDKLIKIKTKAINKDDSSILNTLTISIPNSNQRVYLKDVAELIYKPSLDAINKDDGERINSLFGSLNKEILTSGEFLEKVKPTLDEIKKDGIKVYIKGEEKANKKIKREMAKAAIMAIFLIFIALIWMFDSIKLSLFVLSSIPLSLFGVMIGNIIMGINLTMPGLLGVVGLAGVVVNDGIIMIDFIRRAKTKEEFIQKATMRLRPILLTSITTIIGLSTLIFFAEGQSVILQPMAISLGYGLLWATVINLFFLPTLYALTHKITKGEAK